MRRIVERTVTVVTTTTWTISWQEDALHLEPQADSVADDIPESDLSHATAKHIQKFSPVIQTKEAEPAETKTEPDPMADDPLLNPNSIHQKSKGNEKP